MRRITNAVLGFGFVFGCTSYDDNIKINIQNYKTLTPENIETNLKIANLILDQVEFEEMYTNYNEDIEIEGLFNLYKNGVTLIENKVVELEVKGIGSAAFKLKSLGVKFLDSYNNEDRKLIDPEILSFHSLDKIKAFRFRNSGSDVENSMLKDISYTKLAIEAGLNLDLTYAEQTVVFINNKYLGVMNLRTEANTNGVSRLYGVSNSAITLAKVIEGGIVEKKDGDFDRIDNFITAIENWEYDYVSNEIDVDNFIDYMIFESYIGNRDWPKNNVRFFAVNDGLFRFILFDLDLVATQNIDESPISFINNPINNPITDLFNIMYENEEFKQTYDNRFQYLMNSTLLSSSRFNTIVTEYKTNIEDIMPTQINKYSYPETLAEWYLNLEYLKNNFKIREDYVWYTP
jgi:hypothetical protein|tara:strand:- start:36 stop:1244 length:1209 start_codon:yes stop_codon:yes gene_type:complete